MGSKKKPEAPIDDWSIQFRGSGASPLFTSRKQFTEEDHQELSELVNRKLAFEFDPKNNKWLVLDEKRLDVLRNARDSYSTLPAGAITYVHELVNEEVYDYTSRVYTKAMQKGHMVEDEVIELHNHVFFTNYKKCPEDTYLKNKYFTGHPDVLDDLKTFIMDAKAPWNKKTHPKTEKEAYDSGYEWQDKIYLYLKRCEIGLSQTSCIVDTRWTTGRIFFGLCDTPQELLDVTYEDLSLHEGMNLLPLGLRATWFDVTLTDDDIFFMVSRAKAAQKEAVKYRNELLAKI